MRIVNLVENTEGQRGCACAHGLSFYVETRKHRILVDAGPDGELLLSNAEKLGVALESVDTVILSHGHYDHGDGLAAFRRVNPDAAIYARRGADGDFLSVHDGGERYIGLSEEVKELPGIIYLDEDFRIDEELFVFGGIGTRYPSPSGNREHRQRTEDGLRQDRYDHEMCLVITEDGLRVLMSGCAHHGILNVLERFREVCGGEPDVVISGFHMKKHGGFTDEDIRQMLECAEELKKYGKTKFYTCHCTGTGPYRVMKQVAGTNLNYIHCGDELVLKAEKKRRTGHMKQHRFFAWATVFCFIMTMVTGYRRK